MRQLHQVFARPSHKIHTQAMHTPLLALTLGLLSLTTAIPAVAAKSKCEPMHENLFSAETFMTRIRTRSDIKTVEDALCLIPESVRKNFVAVKQSRSAQGSSPENPRIIMFDVNTSKDPIKPIRYAISFNGDPKHPNYNHIEVMTYRGDSKTPFNFVDIEFNGETEKQIKERVHISKTNPEECMQCHAIETKSPRPIWDAKGFFPTVYGQAGLQGTTVADDDEPAKFARFMENAKTHPRYKMLGDLKKFTTSENGQNLKPLVDQNFRLSSRLAGANYNRLIKLMKETDGFDDYKYLTVASLLSCEPIEPGFYPEAIKQDHKNLSFVEPEFRGPKPEERYAEVETRIGKSFDNKSPFSNISFIKDLAAGVPKQVQPYIYDLEAKGQQWGQSPDKPIAWLRWVFEGRGISMKEWNMDFGIEGYYRFLNAGDEKSIGRDAFPFGLVLLNQDPDMKDLNKPKVDYSLVLKGEELSEADGDKFKDWHKNLCNGLREKSMARLTARAKRLGSAKKEETPSKKAGVK